jgi:hypothetical protein
MQTGGFPRDNFCPEWVLRKLNPSVILGCLLSLSQELERGEEEDATSMTVFCSHLSEDSEAMYWRIYNIS